MSAVVVALMLLAAPPPPPTTPAQQASSPVILMPGLLGFHRLAPFGAYFGDIEAALEREGVDVTALAPPPIADSPTRSRYLMRAIDSVLRRTGAAKVIVIAHSQGGVDTRIVLADPAYAAKIAAVATLSSPHDGTEIADAALVLPRGLVVGTLDWMSLFWQSEQHIKQTEPLTEAVLNNMSRRGMREMNAQLPPAPSLPVPFFSVAAVSGGADDFDDLASACAGGRWSAPTRKDAMHPLFVAGSLMIQSVGGRIANDGVVPTRSQRFGTFLGCVPADHVDWMGWGDHVLGDRDDEGWHRFDTVAFVVELWHALRDVERAGGDARALDAHLARLAALSSTQLVEVNGKAASPASDARHARVARALLHRRTS